jgi:hypothetical protein
MPFVCFYHGTLILFFFANLILSILLMYTNHTTADVFTSHSRLMLVCIQQELNSHIYLFLRVHMTFFFFLELLLANLSIMSWVFMRRAGA